MAGDRQKYIPHVAVKDVAEKPPANVKEPGCQGCQECVEASQEEVFGTVALPVDCVLDNDDRQPGRHRHQDRHQAGARTGALGRDEDPARLHGNSSQIELSMSTSKV